MKIYCVWEKRKSTQCAHCTFFKRLAVCSYILYFIWERWTMQLLLNASYIMDNNDFELLKFWWAAAISLIEFSRICVDGVSGTGKY